MKLDILLGGKSRQVEFASRGGRFTGTIDGRPVEADAVEVAPGVYSVLIGGCCFDVRVETCAGTPGVDLRVTVNGREFAGTVRDPRAWHRRRAAVFEGEGRQKVIAPMPGKVVRLLAAVGDPVEAGQAILVVEAMKMQNEVRSPKSGSIESVLVREGQAVSAGEVLAVVV